MRFLRRALKVFLVLFVVFSVWSVFRVRTPVTVFRRDIVVNVPREVAWKHFSRPMEWRSWLGDSGAPTSVAPSEVVGPDTVAQFGDTFAFRMTEFAPPDHWMWSARPGWLTLDYDHVFEPIGERRTRMVFHMTMTGFGSDLLARALGVATAAGGHAEALQRLADEMNRLPAAAVN
jgi:hypothetical protein